jgi:27-O-demethylrifamycin SV methyltransferase
MESADDPVTHYDHITRAWRYLLGDDFHYGYFHGENESLEAATANLTVLMAEKGALGDGLAVLDVGCGIGSPACFLAQRFGCVVTGISTSVTGVEHARRRAQETGCADRASFVVADGMNNCLADASFDRAWILEASHLMPRKDLLLSECARVLRPGGRMVLCDIIQRRDVPRSEILARSRNYLDLHYAFGHAKMESLETYRRFAGLAGLEVLESIDLSDAVFPTLAHWRRRVEDHREEVRALIGDAGTEHFRAACDFLPLLWREKALGYGLISAIKG